MGRTAIFIDGGYVDKLLFNEFRRARLDMEKVSQVLSRGRDILRTYYYDCPPYQSNPPTEDEKQRFSKKDRYFTALSRLSRFEVRKGKLAFRGCDSSGKTLFQQKRVDIMLGVDMVQLSATRQIDEAVLLAGDGDFTPAVAAVKQNGVLVSLYHGPIRGWSKNGTVHKELWDICDERFEMSSDLIKEMER